MRGSNAAGSRGGNRFGSTSWGWVSITWYCSMNASSASFQFTGRRNAYHHSGCIDSSFQASMAVANGSIEGRSGGAASSRLIQAQPPHVSHRTGRRSRSSGRRLCSENELRFDTKVFFPSGA